MLDEGLGVEEAVEQHLPRRHRHLPTQAPGGAGPGQPRAAGAHPSPPPATAAAILCQAPARPLPSPHPPPATMAAPAQAQAPPTCGRRSRMPAAWMSSQPRMRRSVSHCRSSPSCMEGVGDRRSSGISEWSMVSDTSEYSRSPMRMPGAGAGGGAGARAGAAGAAAAAAGGGRAAAEAMVGRRRRGHDPHARRPRRE